MTLRLAIATRGLRGGAGEPTGPGVAPVTVEVSTDSTTVEIQPDSTEVRVIEDA